MTEREKRIAVVTEMLKRVSYKKIATDIVTMMEAVEYYADYDNWEEYHLNEPLQVIDESDLEYSVSYSNGIGGKKARDVIRELK